MKVDEVADETETSNPVWIVQHFTFETILIKLFFKSQGENAVTTQTSAVGETDDVENIKMLSL